jgi:hypothetical protein
MDRFAAVRKFIGPSAKDWPDEEFEKADYNLRRYVAAAIEIFERLEADALTQSSGGLNIDPVSPLAVSKNNLLTDP